ncbi:MAG TPA: 16S rRNA (adenine(1518)-N(6)/adenine(1519)-N(6))-dimethyltransferase RsmA [Desulfobacteria bacterium]|nr:16S rRNA (adenine(1518)-N(6)/adenine(1519)-N(6))-dimethyltransferase RsmA [Desulfobacteria bacterium]
MKLYSPATVRLIIDKYKFRFQKSLGQNFLIDGNIINKIIDGAGISSQDTVLEIGAGIGTLTRALAEKAGKVIVIELDRKLEPVLEETLAGLNNIDIYWGNALKVNWDELVREKTGGEYGLGGKPYKIAANLPYYITTPLMMHALESHYNVSRMVIMIQKEVAERLTAVPGTKDYGALTVAVNFYSRPGLVTYVPKTVFIPQPEVESAVIKLDVLEKPPVEVTDEKIFFEVVKAAFGQRRKTLANTLGKFSDTLGKAELINLLTEADIDPGRRGETLTLEEFATVADIIFKAKQAINI